MVEQDVCSVFRCQGSSSQIQPESHEGMWSKAGKIIYVKLMCGVVILPVPVCG